MKAFWRLYKKEVRFLLGPGIGMIVLEYVRLLLHYSLPRGNEYAFIFGAILLYSLIYEHLTRSSNQLTMLPIRRSVRIATKYCAVVTWAILYIFQGLVSASGRLILSTFIPAITWPGWGYPSVIAMTIISMTLETIFICALFVFGYTTTLAVRPLKYIVGPAAVIAGYMSRYQIQLHVGPFLREHFHPVADSFLHNPFDSLYYWGLEASYLLAAIILLTIGMILSERYAEV